MLIHSLVNSFHDGLRAILLSGWQRIAPTSTRQRLSRQFSRRIAQWMAAVCSFLRSSTAFPTVCAPYCTANGSGFLSLPVVNCFHDGLHPVLLRGWQRIALTSTRQRLLRRFSRRIAQWMAADCSFFRSSTTFPTVCAPYCTANGSGFLLLPVVNRFHDGSHAVLLSGWQQIADTSARQRLS